MNAQLPIQRSTLDEVERNRARALDLYCQAFDKLHEARSFASLAAGDGSSDASFSEDIRDALAPRYSFSKNATQRRVDFLEKITIQTDRTIWSNIVHLTDLERLMDRTARDELRKQLADTPPPATADNIRATMMSFMEDADMIFRRGIAKAFSGLDRRFRSHEGFKIGSRVILNGAFSTNYSGWNSYGYKDEILRDIERTFYVLDGKQQPDRSKGIVGLINEQFSTAFEVENQYFRVRRFQNGNAHVWFLRKDLILKVNRLLADYYGEVIGEGSDVCDVSDMGPGYHITPAKNFGLFESPAAVVDEVFNRLGRIAGTERVLEPSAGRGRLADRAEAEGCQVTCVEIQPNLVAELRAKGHSVKQADFLTLEPSDIGTFDIIVMNPPFDQGRDCDHVRHALKFLAPGGRLVAVMAAGVEFRETKRAKSFVALVNKMPTIEDRWARDRFQDLPPLSFAESGTNINTLTLGVRAPA